MACWGLSLVHWGFKPEQSVLSWDITLIYYLPSTVTYHLHLNKPVTSRACLAPQHCSVSLISWGWQVCIHSPAAGPAGALHSVPGVEAGPSEFLLLFFALVCVCKALDRDLAGGNFTTVPGNP